MLGDLNHKHKEMMKLLLYMDTLRGEDSTGISCVHNDDKITTLKYTMPGYDFIRLSSFRDTLRLTDKVWMGHNRFKTQGDISRINAHPFEVYDEEGGILLVGTHNGTIGNRWAIPNEKTFGTDSEALFYQLAEVGPKETMNKLRGAWSLVWWDVFEDTVNFLRNDERPMSVCYSKDHEQFFWASESWMLRIAAERCGVELDKETGVQCPNPDTWIKVKVPGRRDPKRIPDYEWEGGLEGAAPLKSGFSGGYGIWGNEYDIEHDKTKEDESKAKEDVGKKAEAGEAVGTSKVIGFEGKLVEKDDAQTIASMIGCEWCGDTVNLLEPFAWVDDDALVCHNCLRGTHYGKGGEDAPKNNIILLNDRQRTALDKHREATKGVSVK